MTTENNKKAGDAWFAYIEKFPKLKEYFNGMGELAALYFAQQIDIFAGKYPATPPSIEGEIKSKEEILKEVYGTPICATPLMLRSMEAYASQFTASKEKEYREENKILREILFEATKKYEAEMTNPFCMDWFKKAKKFLNL